MIRIKSIRLLFFALLLSFGLIQQGFTTCLAVVGENLTNPTEYYGLYAYIDVLNISGEETWCHYPQCNATTVEFGRWGAGCDDYEPGYTGCNPVPIVLHTYDTGDVENGWVTHNDPIALDTFAWTINGQSAGNGRICMATPKDFQVSGTWVFPEGGGAEIGTFHVWSECSLSSRSTMHTEDERDAKMRECYDQKEPIKGELTVRSLDPLGDTSKSITVCPKTPLRLNVSGVEDIDWRHFQDMELKDPCWRIKLEGWYNNTGTTDNYFTKNWPENDFDTGIPSTSWDFNAPNIPGHYTYTCTISDTNAHGGYPNGIYNFADEYQDPDTVLTVTVDVKNPPICTDSRTSDSEGGSGCSSCSGGSGGMSVDFGTGDASCPIQIPGISDYGIVTICGDATWKIGCCYTFEKEDDGSWVCKEDKSIDLSSSSSSATITTADGDVYTYTSNSSSPTIYEPSQYTDSLGETTTFAYDSITHMLTSITSPDGKITSYGYDNTKGAYMLHPTSITGPDSKTRQTIEYSTNDNTFGLPTKVAVVDPDNSNNKIETNYSYYTSGTVKGKIKSVTTENGLQTRIQYNGSKVEYKWTFDNSKFYSQTSYTYSNNYLPYDGEYYDCTEIREYDLSDSANQPSIIGDNITPANPDNVKDRVVRHYYEHNGSLKFLKAVEQVDYFDAWTEREAVSTIYTRIYPGDATYTNMTENSPLYGARKSATTIDGYVYDEWNVLVTDNQNKGVTINPLTTTYTYYDPNKLHVVSDADAVPYPISTSGIAGNGQIKSVTTPSNQTSYYSYEVVDGVMNGNVSLTKNPQEHIAKGTYDNADQFLKVQEKSGQGAYVTTKEYSYYTDGTYKGRAQSEITYDVAYTGINQTPRANYNYDPARDMKINYYYSTGTLTDENNQSYDVDITTQKVVTYINSQLEEKTVNTSYSDMLGQLRKSVDENNNATDYTYDYRGNSLKTTHPAIVDRTNPLIAGDPVRNYVENHYLDCCNLTDWQMNEEGSVSHYTYNGKSEILKMWSDKIGESGTPSENHPLIDYNYDGFGGIKTITTRSNDGTNDERVTAYTRDRRGRVTKVDYPDSLVGSEEFIYDAQGRIVLKKSGDGKKAAFQYDTYGRKWKVDYEYAGNFELTDPWPSASFVADTTYTYDEATNRITDVTEKIDGNDVTSSYTYYDDGKIKTYTPGFPVGYGTISYEYNGLDQKTSMIVPLGLPSSVNLNARKYVYKYDSNGKQVGMDIIPCNVEAVGVTATSQSGTTTRFTYNERQNRVKLTNKAGDIYFFVYDPTASIPAVAAEICATSNKYYLNIRQPDGSLIGRETYNANGTRTMSRTYSFDGLGSTIAITDENGNVTDNYSYDAWGNVTHTGTTTDNPYQYVGQLGYYTHYQEVDFKMLQLGLRCYDPRTGRFTQKDSANEWFVNYAYVHDRPTIGVDPTGLYTAFQACMDSRGSISGRVGRFKREETRHSIKSFLLCLTKAQIKGVAIAATTCAIAVVMGVPFPVCMQTALTPGAPDAADLAKTIQECWHDSIYFKIVDLKIHWCRDSCGHEVWDNDYPTGSGWEEVDWYTGKPLY